MEPQEKALAEVLLAARAAKFPWHGLIETTINTLAKEHPELAARLQAALESPGAAGENLPVVSSGHSETTGKPLVFLDGVGYAVFPVRKLAYSLLTHAASAEMAAGLRSFLAKGKDRAFADRLAKSIFPHLDRYRNDLLAHYREQIINELGELISPTASTEGNSPP